LVIIISLGGVWCNKLKEEKKWSSLQTIALSHRQQSAQENELKMKLYNILYIYGFDIKKESHHLDLFCLIHKTIIWLKHTSTPTTKTERYRQTNYINFIINVKLFYNLQKIFFYPLIISLFWRCFFFFEFVLLNICLKFILFPKMIK
jgi:hypothetical protein